MPTIAQLDSLLARAPGDAFLLYALAMEHAKQGRHGEAVGLFRRAIVADSANPYHHYHGALSLEAIDDRRGAIAMVREGIEAAKASGDEKARAELGALLDMWE